MTTNSKFIQGAYAALIRTDVFQPTGRWEEVLVVGHTDVNHPWFDNPLHFHRSTNGGRGLSNAWQRLTYLAAKIESLAIGVHDPFVVALTPHEEAALEAEPYALTKSLTTRLQAKVARLAPVSAAWSQVSIGGALTYSYKHNAVVEATDVPPPLKAQPVAVAAAPRMVTARARTNRPAVASPVASPAPPTTVPVLSWWGADTSWGPDAPVLVPDEPVANDVVDDEPVTALTTTARKAIVLDPEFAASYIHRDVWGHEDFAVLDAARAKGDSVGLYGPTGSAKTTVAKAYAAARGLPYVQVSGTATMEESRMFGRWIDLGRWQDGLVTEVVRFGGVLILDEVNMLPPNISASLFPLLRERILTLHDKDGETVHAHPSLLVVATWNPGYSGTREMNAALANRFGIQVEWGYDDRVEKSLGIVDSLRVAAQRLRASEVKGEVSAPCPTNALVDFQHYAKALGLPFAIGNFVARYHDDVERKAVQQVLDTFAVNIASELGLAQATA